MMLTRLRIEAEGPTTQAVQEDIFALHDAISQVLYGYDVAPQTKIQGEVYEQVESPDAFHPRWYHGRALLYFARDPESEGGYIRERTTWFHRCDRTYDEQGEEFDDLVLPPRE